MRKLYEFDCHDCGQRVVGYYRPVLDRRCASCFWITWNVPTEYQADARERLGVPLGGDELTRVVLKLWAG